MKKRRNHDVGFSSRVALEAVKGERTESELAAEYGVHPTMIHQWKKALLDGAAEIFECGGKTTPAVDEDTVRSPHAKIGELAVANDFFVTKAQALDRQVRRGMIDKNHPSLSVGAQCRLLSISRL
jgi:transposase-like protein